jgi:hypothetical protein
LKIGSVAFPFEVFPCTSLRTGASQLCQICIKSTTYWQCANL